MFEVPADSFPQNSTCLAMTALSFGASVCLVLADSYLLNPEFEAPSVFDPSATVGSKVTGGQLKLVQ